MTTAEDKTVKDTYQVSVRDGIAKISSPEEAKDGKIVETAPIKLDIENQPDATNFKYTATKATTLIKEHKSPEPACEGNGVTKGLNLKEHVEDLGSDALVMIEASRDMDVKIAHKKSHNILLGIGPKVKHSIAKVKKVITGKSSHLKTASPK
ncbi:hypothetical protein LOK49_LG01G04060 [Camellia lanceoleosa]|uniref:Uncharacterized protein n=1 Tax=Camellia lanceoleosa TaxID=1840588 RepID=A0ACC0J4D9_9ERIC|nr:hypothetical protein LOK49_LG01G04060 [Camellia lanceoleosa]